MDKIQRSLPTAITYLVVGLAISLTIIYSLLILAYSWLIEDNIFNRLVASEAHYIERTYSETGTAPSPRSNFISLHKEWKGIPEAVVQGYALDNQKIEYTLDKNRTVHIRVISLGTQEYVLLAEVANFEVSKDYLPGTIFWLIAVASILALIISVIAYFIAKRITNPIKVLADNVSRFSSSSIPNNFVQATPNNELRILANTIEQSFSHLQDALKRETNFTRDVSHEIRTPISIIKNAMSRYQQSGALSTDEFDQISRASFELEKITHTLLALARNESSQLAQVNLTELIENTVLQHFELNNSEKGQVLELELTLADNVIQIVNQNLVQILLNNVLSNIVQYTTGAQVNILLSEGGMTFNNKTAELVPNQPQQRGVKGFSSTGIGQGLNLIERICEINHWTMEADYQAEEFTLNIRFSHELSSNNIEPAN